METKDYGWEIIDPIHPDLIPEPQVEEVLKHGSHDQSDHGNWAHGSGANLFDTTLTAKDGTKVAVVTQGKTYLGGNETTFVGILTVDGKEIGDWERRIGTDYVSCTGLVLGEWGATEKSPFAEKGIGTEFHKLTEQIARELGKENIVVNAVSDGSSVWATEKFGYKFDSSKGAPLFARLQGLYEPSLSNGKETYMHPFMENPENRKQVLSVLESFKGEPSQWATPSQILALGKNGPTIRRTDDYRVGKYKNYTMGEVMLSSGWNGIKSSDHVTKMLGFLRLEIIGIGNESFKKHGSHDQKTHGSWANGGSGKTVTGLINKLSEKRSPGFSIDLRTGTSPKDGFIASDMGAEQAMSWKEASKTRDNLRNVMVNYMDKHAELLDGSGAFFGGWVDEGTLFLDVSRRYPTRSEGVAAGFANEQKAIYDVINDSYIYMKDEVDGRTNKARDDRSTESNQGYDQGRETSLRRQNNRRDDGQPLTFPHVCLGRYTVQKHLQGKHDQETHGNWAGDRYPTDSVKSARDGAKEYAFQKGLKPDETIDYTKVVANRDRASAIADIYENLPKMDRDAVDEYEALASEVEQQFDFMTKNLGVKVSFVPEDPYKTSKEMFDDVSSGNLKVLSTASTGAHPLFSDLQNDKFRAVHDYFGHAATGRGFGQDGEEAAWVHHSQMFTENARAALTTETRGQNSFFNNRGKQFADQKVALLPSEYWEVPAVFTKVKVIYFQPGLKPIIKHSGGDAHGGTDDQSSHGSWATGGYSAEQQAGMAEMEGQGPSIEDLDNLYNAILSNASGPSLDEMKAIVENDQGLYEQATEDIDARVEERLAALQAEFPLHEYSEQEKSTIYENVQSDMIDRFVNDESDTIHQLYEDQNGGSARAQMNNMEGYMNEVYSYEHTGKNIYGDGVTLYSKVHEIGFAPGRDGIEITGVVKSTNGDIAGEFTRTMYKENGVWMVEHDIFQMSDEYKGTGFGTKFIQQQEDWYTARGFGAIIVGTAWDGARHWARAGYDWNPDYVSNNIKAIATEASYNDEFAKGTENRKIFDSIMSRAVEGYQPEVSWSTQISNGVKFKPITNDDFPLPNDFATIGIANKTRDSEGVSQWGGKSLMDNLNLKYTKVLTAEGRSVIEGPVDRDGDGLVYDGTAREKPAPTVNLIP